MFMGCPAILSYVRQGVKSISIGYVPESSSSFTVPGAANKYTGTATKTCYYYAPILAAVASSFTSQSASPNFVFFTAKPVQRGKQIQRAIAASLT
jgi:hypothetical protein